MCPARGALLLALAAAAGCASPPPPRLPVQRLRVTATMSAETQAVLEMAANQVRRCYRAPRVSSEARQIITRLLVRIMADGTLNGLPEVVAQSGVQPGNQFYAPRMAEAAILAVVRCAPLRLPPDFVRGETLEIELTFSPLASA